jgi:hypothetical protein
MVDKEDWNPETRYANMHITHPATYGKDVTTSIWFALRRSAGKAGSLHFGPKGENETWIAPFAAAPDGGITEPCPATEEALGDCETFSERIEEAAYAARDADAAAMRNTIGSRTGKA